MKTSSSSQKSVYDFRLPSLEGKEIDFQQFKGKKMLIVNTASECGYTPQYTELQHLHETHGDKVNILGFPANNFGGQEPGSNEEIGAFCQKNYGVTFQLFAKSSVLPPDQNPLYEWLTQPSQNGWNTEPPNWNFCKYLIDENGQLLKFYSSGVSPLSEEFLQVL
ncbi:MAG TPA: glutathione peroxidase [Bacteroidia bacterium]|nr:glutathione peroxidase [Bacteroidia bacterium]